MEDIVKSRTQILQSSEDTTTFLGKPIPKKLQNRIFKRVEDHIQVLQKSENASAEEKNKLHTEMIQLADECMNIINKVKTEETKKSESTQALFNTLQQAVSKVKLTSILE